MNPNGIAVGQSALVTGSYWPANSTVQVGLVRAGQSAVEEWVGTAHADASGNFAANFLLSSRWLNAGQITMKAVVSNGPREL